MDPGCARTGSRPAPVAQKRVFPSRRRWWVAAGALLLVGAGLAVWAPGATPQLFRSEVVRVFDHDEAAFCQGLVVDQGNLYEGTGTYGGSVLRRVRLETGVPLQEVLLDRRLFGEGITVWQDKIIQLTWRRGMAIVYDKATFQQLGQISYRGEGWGLTHDGTHWIMSDGSHTLQFLDPEESLATGRAQVVRRLAVRNRGRSVRYLNELEFVDGEILANVWRQDYIVRISPRTGELTGVIDLAHLYPRRQRRSSEDVLNGIAYDSVANRLYVTGKNWPKLFEIRLVPR